MRMEQGRGEEIKEYNREEEEKKKERRKSIRAAKSLHHCRDTLNKYCGVGSTKLEPICLREISMLGAADSS